MEERGRGPGEERRDLEERLSLWDALRWFSLTGFVYGPLDERLSIRDAIQKALRKPVPSHVNWTFCFGGITFVLFLILALTGILLLMNYRPTTAEAYASVVEITNNVPFGWLVRGIHHWAGTLMIVSVFIHMARVFFYRAYRPPRDFNWIAGMILLMITLGFGFTGYLLPWNQLSYWATTVGTEMAGAVPFIGEQLKFLVRGGPDVSQLTLTRFFAIHVVILPAVAVIFLAMHFAMIRRQGVAKYL
ncbi:MAG: cytochrome b N-terminal domain-containing protein [Nitrospinota bacterium]